MITIIIIIIIITTIIVVVAVVIRIHWAFGDKVTQLGRQPLKITNLDYTDKVADPQNPCFLLYSNAKS